MATDGERIRLLRDFLADSFTKSELHMFLVVNEYRRIASAVNEGVGGLEYSFDVAQKLTTRDLVDDRFFDCLTREFPAKQALIRGLREAWHVEDRTTPTSSGSATSAPREDARGVSITIGGDFSGQLAFGNAIKQLKGAPAG
jgi:hypothetical protein